MMEWVAVFLCWDYLILLTACDDSGLTVTTKKMACADPREKETNDKNGELLPCLFMGIWYNLLTDESDYLRVAMGTGPALILFNDSKKLSKTAPLPFTPLCIDILPQL